MLSAIHHGGVWQSHSHPCQPCKGVGLARLADIENGPTLTFGINLHAQTEISWKEKDISKGSILQQHTELQEWMNCMGAWLASTSACTGSGRQDLIAIVICCLSPSPFVSLVNHSFGACQRLKAMTRLAVMCSCSATNCFSSFSSLSTRFISALTCGLPVLQNGLDMSQPEWGS